jgi:hypothetical protein
MAIKGVDPLMYLKLRDRALHFRLPGLKENAIHAVLMDWFVGTGTATVVAVADGAASVYLSSGGGFTGGSESNTALRETALQAVQIAGRQRSLFRPIDDAVLPVPGEVLFYLTTSAGIHVAKANEDNLTAGTDQLTALGNAMQKIIMEYRTSHSKRPRS